MSIKEEQIYADYNAYVVYRDDSADWRQLRDKADQFYIGNQHSKTGSDEIRARSQSDIAINRIRPLLITRVSAMVAQKPTGVVYGTRKEDVGLAQVLMDFIDYHWYASQGGLVMERTVMRQQRNGIGWLALYADNLEDYGRGELRFGDLSYRNVFVDKAAGARPLFDDAPVLIVSKLQRPLDFFNTLPPKVRRRLENDESLYHDNDEIHWNGRGVHAQQNDVGTPLSVTAAYPKEEHADYIRPLDVYRRQVVSVRVLRQKLTGKVYKILDEDYEYTDEEKVYLQKNFSDLQLAQFGLPPEYRELVALEEVEAPVWRIKYYQQVSGKALVPDSEELLPISHYPIVPVVGDDMGNAMPLAEVDHMIGEQEILNAAIGLTLLNAALSSNWRVLVDAGRAGLDPGKLQEFQRSFSIPGSWHNVKFDPVTGKFPGEIVRPEPLPVAWFSLVQYFAQAMEFQMSTFSFRTGDPAQAPETLGATMQLGQWANDVLRIPLGRLEAAIERSFNTLLEWMPNFYTFHKAFQFIGADNNSITREINKPYYSETKQAWETINSLADIRANYRIRLGSTTPSQTVYELGILQQLAQQQPALIMNVIDRLPGLRESEKSQIRQTIDQVFQLQQDNNNKGQIIQTLQVQLQRLQESVVALQRERAVSSVEPEISAFMERMKAMEQDFRKRIAPKNGKTR